MNKDPKIEKEILSPEELDEVAGGRREPFDMEAMQKYMEDIMSQKTTIKEALEMPHKKKETGKLKK